MSTTFAAGSARRRRSANAWGIEPGEPGRADQIRPLDLAAFASFGFTSVQVPGVGLPVNEVLPLLLCGVCLTRPAAPGRIPAWFAAGLVALLVWLGLTSYVHHFIDPRRLLHLVLYVTLAFFIASGRIHLRSMALGLSVGLCTSIVAAIGGFGAQSYGSRLVGFFGDPNGGGYVVTSLGAVALGLLPRGWPRRALVVLVPIAVVLTYSRTTLLALTFALVWLLIGRRVNVLLGALIALGMVYVVGHIPPQLKLLGPFADRKGSDQLRARIITQEHLDIAHSPLTGSGAGTAHVLVGQQTFFYHSSYLALQREGGTIAQVILLGTAALLFVVAISRRRDLRNPWLEIGVICVAVCAVNLGEVLLELPAAVVIGVLAGHLANGPHGPPRDEGRHLPAARPSLPPGRRAVA